MSTPAAEVTATLGWMDYLVIGAMLAISSAIGVYYRFTGGRQKTTEEYFSADRSMTAAPLALALMVSYNSAIGLLGVSSENYVYGTQMLVLYFGFSSGTIVAPFIYLPVFFELQCATVYEYLEKRFGSTARLFVSIATFSRLLLYAGIVLYAPALTLKATTGLSDDLSVLLIGGICMFYSTTGGIKAVLMTNIFQGILMFVSVIMVIVSAAINVEGGIAGIWQKAVDGGRVEFDNFSFDPTTRYTWWGLMIAGFCSGLSVNGISQVQVQRLLTVKTFREAKLATWGSCIPDNLLGLITSFAGLSIYAYFKDCDPITAGEITVPDMLMPHYVMKTVGHIPGLPGLFIISVFSGSLSTFSGLVNSLAAIALEDYIKPSYSKLGYEFPESRGTLIGKILAVAIGILGILVAFLAKNMGSLIQASLSIDGAIGGPLLGIFTLGMFFESAEEKGAVFGTLFSLAIVCWSAFGQPRPSNIPLPVSISGCNATLASTAPLIVKQEVVGDSTDFYLYRVSYVWYAPLGLLLSVVVGLAASNLIRLVTKQTIPELNPDLFTPPIADRIRKRRLNVAKNSKTETLGLEIQGTDGVYPS